MSRRFLPKRLSNLGSITDQAFPRSFLAGMITSNSTGDVDFDLDISEGECRDSSDNSDITLSSTLTKQIDALWASGDDAGGNFSGVTHTLSTWYHVFMLRNPTTGAVDAGFDTSFTATNISNTSGYTEFRRIAHMRTATPTGASGSILTFAQVAGTFQWDAPVSDVDVNNAVTTSGVLRTLSAPRDTYADIFVTILTSGADVVFDVFSTGRTDRAPTSLVGGVTALGNLVAGILGSRTFVRVGPSSGVLSRPSANCQQFITTMGWHDTRGKDE